MRSVRYVNFDVNCVICFGVSHSIHGPGIFTYLFHSKDPPNVGKYTIHGHGVGIFKRFALSKFWDLLTQGSIAAKHPYFSLQTIHTKPSSNPWDNNSLLPQKKATQYEISNWHWLVLYVTVSLFLLAIPVPCKHTSVIINYSLFRNHAPLITSE